MSASEPWIRDIMEVMCHPEDKVFLDELRSRGVTITAFDRIYFEDPYFDGTRWTTREFKASGTLDGMHIDMIRVVDAGENAATIYHEGVHTAQPQDMPWREREYDTFSKEDSWRIRHDLPPRHPSFRSTDAGGKEFTDEAAVRALVDAKYPGVTVKSADGELEQITGTNARGDVIVERGDGSEYTRPPQAGDSFSALAPVKVPPQGIPVDLGKLR